MGSNGSNLEKAYEDLEREIKDIKSKLQRSMGGGSTVGDAPRQIPVQRAAPRSPGEDAEDYSLSASELNASLYNSSNRANGAINVNLSNSAAFMGSQEYGNNTMAPKFQY